MMGRVSSFVSMLCLISVPIGYFFGGIFADKYKVTSIVLIYGICVLASALTTVKSAITEAKQPVNM
jgi:predicted MFS family arabinose efflux permease